MNKIEHLLTCLLEECSEIQKATAKALRFGLDDHAPDSDSTNAEDIAAEIIDLISVIELLKEEKIILNSQDPQQLIEKKKEKINFYMEYAKKRGTLKGT